MHTGNQTIRTKAQASFTELLDDREAIILDLENLHYYTLNAAAILLWKQLRGGAAQTAPALSAVLAESFGLTREEAERDTQAWLEEMARNGLIAYTAEAAPPPAAVARPADLPPYETPQLKLSNSLTEVVLAGSSIVGPTAAISGGG
jgi:hypothetical protein